MIILGLQETDWLTRGPHTQHHIFERLSKNPNIKITVLDYDIDKLIRSQSLFIKKKVYSQASTKMSLFIHIFPFKPINLTFICSKTIHYP